MPSITGEIDFIEELACKKSLQRSGDKVACKLAKTIAQYLPSSCGGCMIPPPPQAFGVIPFQNRVGFPVGGQDLATMVETALTKRVPKVVTPMSADIVVSGVISDWKLNMIPIKIPILGVFFHPGIMEMTLDMRLFNLETLEIQADVVTDSETGFEVLGIRFGLTPRGLARKVAQQIADRAARLSR